MSKGHFCFICSINNILKFKVRVTLNACWKKKNIKRIIGRQFDDTNVQNDMKTWPFKVINQNGKPYIEVEYKGKYLKKEKNQIIQ